MVDDGGGIPATLSAAQPPWPPGLLLLPSYRFCEQTSMTSFSNVVGQHLTADPGRHRHHSSPVTAGAKRV